MNCLKFAERVSPSPPVRREESICQTALRAVYYMRNPPLAGECIRGLLGSSHNPFGCASFLEGWKCQGKRGKTIWTIFR